MSGDAYAVASDDIAARVGPADVQDFATSGRTATSRRWNAEQKF